VTRRRIWPRIDGPDGADMIDDMEQTLHPSVVDSAFRFVAEEI
jgi:hypothetical protein